MQWYDAVFYASLYAYIAFGFGFIFRKISYIVFRREKI